MGTREKIDRKKRLKTILGLTDEGMSIFDDALHEVATKEKKKQLKKGITYKDYSMRTDVLLKEKCKKELYKMLPYNELFFEVYVKNNKITSIEFQLRNKIMIIKPNGECYNNTHNYPYVMKSKEKRCMYDIFLDFRDEIIDLFNMAI